VREAPSYPVSPLLSHSLVFVKGVEVSGSGSFVLLVWFLCAPVFVCGCFLCGVAGRGCAELTTPLVRSPPNLPTRSEGHRRSQVESVFF